MPDTATLARRDAVELIRTGRWNISTGQWTASRDDLAAAVAAMSCPAVRKPVLKIGHTDDRFTPTAGDGEPAIGWIDNLRLADGGHTLLGDYVGVPAWLDSIMASAYPDRSVEGTYRHRCQLGHTHPFVLTGVALLGVTPPGVGTLRSLNSLDDVKALYGIAAGADEVADGGVRIAASVPGAALRAAAEDTPQHTGAMVALVPRAEDAARLAVEGGEPADELHVTLLYLGEAAEFTPKAQAAVVDAVRRATTDTPTVEAHAFAVSVFNPPGAQSPDGRQRDTCLVLGIGGDDLEYAQALAASAARQAALQFSVDVPEQHRPWVPHMTLAYTDDLTQLPALADRAGPVVFDRVRVAFAGQHTDIPLTAVGGDEAFSVPVPNTLIPVAAARDGNLRDYWVHGEGAAKIRWGTGGDFTRCVRHLRKYVADPKGLCAEYHHEATGMWPGDRRNVHASEEDAMPNPQPSLVERIHQAWNAAGQPEQQWIVEAAPDEVIVMDNTDRSLVRVPVTVDGDDIRFGDPQRVRPAYVPADEPVAASRLVFASAEESRPDVAAHGSHNQKSHGRRYRTPGDRSSGLRERGKPSGNDAVSGPLSVGTPVMNRSRPGLRGVVKNAPAGSGRNAGQSSRDDFGSTDVYVEWSDKDGKKVSEGWFPRRGMEPASGGGREDAADDPQPKLPAAGHEKLKKIIDERFPTGTKAKAREWAQALADGDKRKADTAAYDLMKQLNNADGDKTQIGHLKTLVDRTHERLSDMNTARNMASLLRTKFPEFKGITAREVTALGLTGREKRSEIPDIQKRLADLRKGGGAKPDAPGSADAQKDVASRLAETRRKFNQDAEQRELASMRTKLGLPSDSDIDRMQGASDQETRNAGRAAKWAVNDAREIAQLRTRLAALDAEAAVYRDEKKRGGEGASQADAALTRIAQEKTNAQQEIKNLQRQLDNTLRDLKNRGVIAASADATGEQDVPNDDDLLLDPDDLFADEQPQTEPDGDPAPGDDPARTGGEPTDPPAAEPEPNTETKEDPVSDLSAVRSRLGLTDDATPDAILAAVDALKAKADAAPSPEQVAASQNEMKAEIARLSGELARINASAAADAKTRLFDDAVRSGRIAPADRGTWEERYDRAPEVTADILASLAPNTAVPVAAAGYTGQADAPTDDMEAFEREMARLDGVPAGGN